MSLDAYYPDGLSAAEFDRIHAGTFVQPDPDTLSRLRDLHTAAQALALACAALIAAGEDDAHLGGYCPSELMPDVSVLRADPEMAAMERAERIAEREAEYLADEAAERRGWGE